MKEQQPGLIAQIKSYPTTFWVANTMEIFERMAWYGWFTVMAVYVTGSVETGGLGFTTETRGLLQGIVPFFLYLMPVLTGALADRYGYRKMFIIAYVTMVAAYYLLGQVSTVPTFFLAFMFVAVGAAIFKPVVVGTVATVTNESNSATAFGIFYMMVNIGGFFGPIVAGRVRGYGWNWVFVACSCWAFVNLLIVLIFYREPTTEAASATKRKLSKVLDDLVEVLGNLRFFLTVGVILVALMAGNLLISVMEVSWLNWWLVGAFCVLWIILNLVYDTLLPAGSGRPIQSGGAKRFFLLRRMHCSNWRFALFLLIMSGFWTSFNQIFYTMPEYLRDFVDTRPLIETAKSSSVVEFFFGESHPDDPKSGVASEIATISEDERKVIVREVDKLRSAESEGRSDDEMLTETSRALLLTKVRLAPTQLRGIVSAQRTETDARIVAKTDELILARRESIEGCMNDASVQQEHPNASEQQDACEDKWNAASKELLAEASESLKKNEIFLSASALGEMANTSDKGTTALLANHVIMQGRQVNPEFIVNINAGAIVLFQVMISFLMARFHRFTTMIVGMLIASVGIGFSTFAGGEGMVGVGSLIWVAAGGIFIFSFGEMMASPTSQEYVGRIAPSDRKALYMGYYFVAVALGNLFGGILSGQLYGSLARDMQRPDLLWMCFGGIMLGTAFMFLIYNKFALPKVSEDSLTSA